MAKRFQLDPNQTAQENLWRALRVATAYLLSRKSVRIRREDWDDVFDDLVSAGYCEFMRRFRLGQYDRNHSWYENAYSCVWGKRTFVLRRYIQQAQLRMETASLDDTVSTSDTTTLIETISNEARMPLYNPEYFNGKLPVMTREESAMYGAPRSPKRHPLETMEAVWRKMEADGINVDNEHKQEIRDRITCHELLQDNKRRGLT